MPPTTSSGSAAAPSPSGSGGVPPLAPATRHWYSLGQFAEGLKNESYSIFLLFFYTQVVGLSGVLAGQAILIALLFDAVTDPLVGVVSDRFESRYGRRHPFLYAAALPVALFFYLSFAPPDGLSQFGLFLWLTTTVVLTRASMTLFHVPHLALGAELSSQYEERTAIVTMAYFYTRVGHALAGALAFLWFFRPTAEYAEGRFNPEAYPALAGSLALLMFASVMLSAQRTQHRVPYLGAPSEEARHRRLADAVWGDFVESLRNESFRSLFLGLLLTYVCFGVATALGLYTATYFWFVSNEEIVVYGIFTALGIFVGLPFWQRAAAKLDKKPTFMIGIGVFTLFTALPPLMKMLGFWPAQGSMAYVSLWAFTVGGVAHFGLAATMATGRSMMADVTDEDALRYGRRREGIFFGALSFSAKAAFGIGSQIAGFVVDLVGLVPGQDPASVALGTTNALGTTLALAVLVCCGGSLGFFSRYDLDRARYAEISAALEARAAAGGRA